MSTTLFSLAFGVGTQNRQGTWLEVFYAQPLLNPASELVAKVIEKIDYQGGNHAIMISNNQAGDLAEALKNIDAAQSALLTRLAESQKPLVVTLLVEDSVLTSTPEAYLKLHLLSPARRPVQVTQDLASFWANTYLDVKKDLKGRYPKHYWPDDPLIAEPTARIKPRK